MYLNGGAGRLRQPAPGSCQPSEEIKHLTLFIPSIVPQETFLSLVLPLGFQRRHGAQGDLCYISVLFIDF